VPEVLTAREGRIGQITLHRPDAMNAVTVTLARELQQALRQLAGEADVIVIRGAGGNFSVGGDIDEVERLRADGPDALAGLFEAFGAACATIAELPVPVLAAVEGYALAGGFELMQACDVAIVRDDARIADHHANFGVIPGGGSTQRLPRLVGRQRALALILSGERLGGAEAVAWGLAYKSVPATDFEDAVQELANRLAGRDRDGQMQIKRLVHEGLELPLAEGLARERAAVVDHLIRERGVAWRGAQS
jgi:enoyl-CoA hydratase/carnithine racemase